MAKNYSKVKACANASSNSGHRTYKEKVRRKDKKFLKKLLANYNPEEIDEIYEDYEIYQLDLLKYNFNDKN